MGSRRIARTPIALGAVMVAAAAACAGTADPPAGGFEPNRPGVLTIATNLPAPGFWNGSATDPTGGFEHGLADALRERFGLDEVRVVDVPFDALVAGDLGGADLALAQITPTDERDEVLDFTTTYLDANPAVIVRSGTDVGDLAAARELTWVVQDATTAAALVDEVIRPDSAVLRVSDIPSVVEAVRAGSVAAGLLDLPTAIVEEQLTDGAVVVAAQFATDDGLAIAVTDGDDNLEALDSAVRALLADGTVDDLAERFLARDTEGAVVDVPLIRYQPVAP